MQLAEAIAQHVLDVHAGGNWTEVNLAHTLADVTLAEATTPTASSPNTIASLVRHLAYWNRVLARRAHGQPTKIGFDAGALLDPEADWQALLADLQRSGQELAAAIRAVPDAGLPAAILPGYASAYKNLQGAVEHLHYHLGPLVLLKNLVRRPAGRERNHAAPAGPGAPRPAGAGRARRPPGPAGARRARWAARRVVLAPRVRAGLLLAAGTLGGRRLAAPP